MVRKLVFALAAAFFISLAVQAALVQQSASGAWHFVASGDSRNCGDELPGWIVGTGGAVRYALPPNSSDAHGAMTNVYRSLLATVQPSGEISFEFEKLSESDIPAPVTSRYGKDFVHWCFAENSQAK